MKQFILIVTILLIPDLSLAQTTVNLPLSVPGASQLTVILGQAVTIYLLGKWIDSGQRFSFDLLKTASLAFLTTILTKGILLYGMTIPSFYRGLLAFPYLDHTAQQIDVLRIVNQWYFYTLLFLGLTLIYQIIAYAISPKSAVSETGMPALDDNSPLSR